MIQDSLRTHGVLAERSPNILRLQPRLECFYHQSTEVILVCGRG